MRPGEVYRIVISNMDNYVYLRRTQNGYQAYWFNKDGQFRAAAESEIIRITETTQEFKWSKRIEIDDSTQADFD